LFKILAQELVTSRDKRALASFCMNSAFCGGGMAVSLIAYLVPDWDWIYRILAIIGGLCFPILW